MAFAHTSTSTRGGDAPITYRPDTSDELVLAEFERDPYATRRIQPGEHWLDIGANIGLFSVHALAAGALVEAFEPDQANYHLLETNISAHQGASLHPLAVTARGERVSLRQDDPDAFWQIRTVADSAGQPSLALRQIITDGCRIKLDVEGAEQGLILDTPLSAWRRVDRIVMEYHLDRLSLADFSRAKAHLAHAGLMLHHPRLDSESLGSYQSLERPFIVSAERRRSEDHAGQRERSASPGAAPART